MSLCWSMIMRAGLDRSYNVSVRR